MFQDLPVTQSGLLHFRWNDRVLHRLRDAELYDFLDRDLDCFTSGGIAAGSGFSVHTYKTPHCSQHKNTLLLSLGDRESSKFRQELLGSLVTDARLVTECPNDLSLSHSIRVSHTI